MGECGCGETRPHKIVDLGDSVMVVEIYDGCRYCETGIVVTLHKLTPEEAKEWDWEPDTKFERDHLGISQLNFPIVGQEDLIAAAKQMGYQEGDQLLEDLSDIGLELLQRAVRIRLAETEAAK
jgi:hypothetical protein